MFSSVISVIQKIVIACHVSVWRFLLRGEVVKDRQVAIAMVISYACCSVMFKVFAKLQPAWPPTIILLFLGILGTISFLGGINQIRKGLARDMCILLTSGRGETQLSRDAFLMQLCLRRQSLLYILFMIPIYLDQKYVTFNLLSSLMFLFFLFHTLKSFVLVGLVLTDKDPPKKKEKKEEDKKTGDFSLNGA